MSPEPRRLFAISVLFAFLTSYEKDQIHPEFRGVPFLLKPLDPEDIFSSVALLLKRECHELCVSGLAHAGFRYSHALKRSSNITAK
jgi:hypothetical protein